MPRALSARPLPRGQTGTAGASPRPFPAPFSRRCAALAAALQVVRVLHGRPAVCGRARIAALHVGRDALPPRAKRRARRRVRARSAPAAGPAPAAAPGRCVPGRGPAAAAAFAAAASAWAHARHKGSPFPLSFPAPKALAVAAGAPRGAPARWTTRCAARCAQRTGRSVAGGRVALRPPGLVCPRRRARLPASFGQFPRRAPRTDGRAPPARARKRGDLPVLLDTAAQNH